MYDYDYNEYSYDYSNGYTTTEWGQSYTTIENPAVDQIYAMLPIIGIMSSVFGLLMIVCIWKIFKKAGKHGWASIVPIYNVIVQIEVSGLPLWYFILLLIPFVNIYATFKIYIEIAHKFGKSTGFGVASVFFPIICLPILAFGKCTYKDKEDNLNVVNNVNNNGVNTMQNQNVVNSIEVQGSNPLNNNVENVNQEPVIPSFIPTSDTTNNMQSDVNKVEPTNNVNIENINKDNSISESNNIMGNVNSPIDNSLDNNSTQVVPVVEDVSLNGVNPIESNLNNINETISNPVEINANDINENNNAVDTGVNMEVNNLVGNDTNINTNVVDVASNTVEQPIIPEIQSISIMPNMNNTNELEENNVSDTIDTNDNSITLEDNTVSEVNSIPVMPEVPSLEENNVVDNQINNTITDEGLNIISEIHDDKDITLENNRSNMSDTMSLNELLADIEKEEQK